VLARKEQRDQKKLRGGDLSNEEIYEKVNKKEKKMDANGKELIFNCFKKHFVFYALNDSDMETIISKMAYYEVNDGDFIFN